MGAYVILCEHHIMQQVEVDILTENNFLAIFREKTFNYMCVEEHKHDSCTSNSFNYVCVEEHKHDSCTSRSFNYVC